MTLFPKTVTTTIHAFCLQFNCHALTITRTCSWHQRIKDNRVNHICIKWDDNSQVAQEFFLQLWNIHHIHKQRSESGGLGQLDMVIPNKWSNKTLPSFTACCACTRQKGHTTDPSNTTGLYPLVCIQDSLIHSKLPLQQHVSGARPGLHSRDTLRQWMFPAKQHSSQKRQETLWGLQGH